MKFEFAELWCKWCVETSTNPEWRTSTVSGVPWSLTIKQRALPTDGMSCSGNINPSTHGAIFRSRSSRGYTSKRMSPSLATSICEAELAMLPAQIFVLAHVVPDPYLANLGKLSQPRAYQGHSYASVELDQSIFASPGMKLLFQSCSTNCLSLRERSECQWQCEDTRRQDQPKIRR